VSVALGLLFTFFIAIGVSLGVLSTLAPTLNGSTSYETYYVRNDGEIEHNGIDPSGQEKLTDLQGRALANQDLADLYSHRADGTILNLRGVGPEDMSVADRVASFGFHSSDGHMRQIYYSTPHSGDVWVYVVQRRTIEGYDSFSPKHSFMGYIGPDATLPTRAFPDPMILVLQHGSGEGNGTIIVASRTTAYDIDLANRRVSVLFSTPVGEAIQDMGWVWGSPTLNYFAIATKTAVHIVSEHGEEFRLPLEQRDVVPQSLAVGKTTSDQYVFRFGTGDHPRWLDQPGSKQWVIKTDLNGNLLSRTDLPPLPPAVVVATDWLDEIGRFFTPASFLVGYTFVGDTSDLPPLSQMLYESALVWLVCLGVALRLFPHYGIKGRAAVLWLVIVALLEIPGVLLLISLRDRLALVKCPSCGRLRSVNSEKCRRCSAPFEKPAEEGIEVLELSPL
jgi:hypothetical protein